MAIARTGAFPTALGSLALPRFVFGFAFVALASILCWRFIDLCWRRLGIVVLLDGLAGLRLRLAVRLLFVVQGVHVHRFATLWRSFFFGFLFLALLLVVVPRLAALRILLCMKVAAVLGIGIATAAAARLFLFRGRLLGRHLATVGAGVRELKE